MKNLKKKFQEDPIFAAGVLVAATTAAAALVNAVGYLIGSSGYALHAIKRKK